MGNTGSNRPQSAKSFKIGDVFHHDKGTYGTEDVPEPKPTTVTKAELLRKVDFTKVDQKALNVSTDLLMETFWDIVEHIIVKKSFEYIDDVLRVRAIFRWMTSFDVESIEMEMLPPENSPIDYLMNIQQDFGDHCHLFYALCQIADIPCVIINGMTKNMLYVIGDDPDRELLDSRWNAVFVKGQWRLVDPYWAYSCIEEGTYDDKISIDAKGKIKRAGQGQPARPVNEFFFLADPSELILTHFPDDPQWQLLDKPWSVVQWQNAPYIREHFHLLGMKMNAKYNSTLCLLKTKADRIDLGFDLPESRSHNFKYAHNLVLIKSEHSSEGKSLRHFVMFEHLPTKLNYTVRLPFPGTYRLDIYGKDTVSDKLYHLLCTYGIKCERKEEIEITEYPDCPHLGWGPNAYAVKSGVVPAPKLSIIEVNKEVDISITMNKLRTVNHRMKCKTMDDAQLSRFSTGRFENGKYLIHVKIPYEGEFALKVFGTLSSEPEDSVLTNLLTFLIKGKNQEVEAQPLPAIMGDHLGMQSTAEEIGVSISGQSKRDLRGISTSGDEDSAKNNDSNKSSETKTNPNAEKANNQQNKNESSTNPETQGTGENAKTGNGEGDLDGSSSDSADKNKDGKNTENQNKGDSNNSDGKGFASAAEIASGQITADGGIVKLKFDANPDVRLYPELCSTDDLASKVMTCEKYTDEDGNWIFELDMPVKGLYSFNLIGRNDKNKTKPIYSGLINSSGHPFPDMLKGTNESKQTSIKHETIVTQEPMIVLPVLADVRYISTSLQSSTIPEDQLHRVTRVVKKENELEVHLKFPGEFTLDIFKSETDDGLTTLARYYIVRKFNPEIDHDSWDDMDLGGLFDEEETDYFNRPVTKASRVRFKDTKKTIKQNIKKAISQKDLNKLLRYMNIYGSSSNANKLSREDTLALEANKMIKFLQAQKYLDRACQSKTEDMLEDAVARAKQAGFTRTLNSKIIIATRLLGRIYKIENDSKNGSGIDQKSLSELKKYQVPPNGVHQTMVAALLLLGYGLDHVKDWHACQGLLMKSGKESLSRKIALFDHRTVDDKVLQAVKKILEPFKYWQIRDVSKGAAAVFLWVKGIIRVIEYQQGNLDRCQSGKSVLSRRVAPRKSVLPEYSIEKNGTIIFESEEWYSDDDW